MLEGHGNELSRYRGRIKADFSSNVVPGGMHKALKQHLAGMLGRAGNYPEVDGQSLAAAIAAFWGLEPGRVQVFNGSTEAFYLLAQLFAKQHALVAIPAFAEYADACRAHKLSLSWIHYAQLQDLKEADAAMIWVGNPNNPDGQLLSPEEVSALCLRNAQSLVVLDEAYAGLCSHHQSALPLLAYHPNLVIVKSFTKVFAIPGLRLGYLCGAPALQQALSRIRMPWSVNLLALEAGHYILQNYKRILPDIPAILNQSLQLQKALSAMPGLKVYPSSCNYFLCELQEGTAAALKQYLIDTHGFLIRDASNFRGLRPEHFRIAAQSEVNNLMLIKALEQWTRTQL